MALRQYLECGCIVNTHGVYGAVKALSYCDSPSVLAGLKVVYTKKGETYVPVKVIRASVFKQFVLLTLEGVTTLDQAMTWKNTVIYAARQDIPLKPGAHFLADLEGLPVLDAESGQLYGTLTEVINRGASDIYVIETPNGSRMVPAVSEFVREVDPEKAVYISPIEGMLD